MPRERREPILHRRIEGEDPYFGEITVRWMELLLEATHAIPNPAWMVNQYGGRRTARGGSAIEPSAGSPERLKGHREEVSS
jgi:hypothetical protein